MDLTARGRTIQAGIGAVVTLGPESAARMGVPVGTQIDHGMVSYYHRNPLKRLRFWALRKLGRKVAMF